MNRCRSAAGRGLGKDGVAPAEKLLPAKAIDGYKNDPRFHWGGSGGHNRNACRQHQSAGQDRASQGQRPSAADGGRSWAAEPGFRGNRGSSGSWRDGR